MSDEVQDLAGFISAMGGDRRLRVEESLGDGYVRLRVSEAERRQAQHDVRRVEDVVIELLRNARDAGARHIYVASARESDVRTLVVADDGCGIPPSMHEAVFEARVTSKLDSVHMDRWGVHGRGMALYAVRENALEARVMSSAEGKGCSLRVRLDVGRIPERADQSAWPKIGIDDDGEPSVVRGPHNIVRACAEFALEEHGRCEVYLGSVAEVVASARRHARPSADRGNLALVDDLSELGVLERLYVATDARELQEVCASLGLELSERTCHRIVGGEIAPTKSVYTQLCGEPISRERGSEVDLMRDRRRRRISERDAKDFARIMERDFSYIAERYYLALNGEVRVRMTKDSLVVTFPFVEPD